MSWTLEDARACDAADPLADWRSHFLLPEGIIYLDGNSLGALPAATPGVLARVTETEWGRHLISSWNRHDWIGASQRVGARIAPLIGAEADEVIVADSVSVNLTKLIAAALALRPGRGVILSEPGNFPTDLYMVQGLERMGLCSLRLAPVEDFAQALDGDVAAVLLSQVHYKSAAVHDMAALTAAAHAHGALTIWDLSHAVGAMPVALNPTGADFAVGCGYKYLNGGPGAPAFAFAARRHHAGLEQSICGWMGHAAPFAFDDAYAPAPGMKRLLAGTPPILSLAALEVGVRLIGDIGVSALHAKSMALSQCLIDDVSATCADFGIALASPPEAGARGSHVALRHPEAYPICQALIAAGVVGDFRAPDILRFGIAPAYVSFEDIWTAARRLEAVLRHETWRAPEFAARQTVT
jgi:kynureninase